MLFLHIFNKLDVSAFYMNSLFSGVNNFSKTMFSPFSDAVSVGVVLVVFFCS